MPERWEHELRRLGDLDVPPSARTRLDEGPRGEGVPPPPGRGQRIVAGVVAFAVFGGALALALGAFGRDEAPPIAPTPPGAVVVTLRSETNGPTATMEVDGVSVDGYGSSTCWEQRQGVTSCFDVVGPAFSRDDLVPIEAGSPLVIEGDADAWTAELVAFPLEPYEPIADITFQDRAGRVPDDPGRYVLVMSAAWPQGERQFSFPVRVVPVDGVEPLGVVVPDLIGLDDQAAMARLDELGLPWIVGYREHPEAPPWEVVGQAPPGGTEVANGTAISLEIATRITPLPPGAAEALSCDETERVPFGGPNARILPGGALYITGNLSGIQPGDEVVQVTSPSPYPSTEWDGIWHVIRDGRVVAVVEWASLDGVACAGTGVAGA